MEEDLLKGSRTKRGVRRWEIKAPLSIPVLLLVVVGASCVMARDPNPQDMRGPDRRFAAQSPSVSDSSKVTQTCGWNSMKSYLESLLEDVGGPESVALDGGTLNPTQNGLRLTPQEYERRLDVFVTSDNQEDPVNQNTQGMNLAAHHGGFTVYRARNPESDVLISDDHDTAWSISLVSYPYRATVDWTDDAAPVEWMLQAIDYSNARPPPICLAGSR